MKQVVEKDKMIDPRFLWKNRAASTISMCLMDRRTAQIKDTLSVKIPAGVESTTQAGWCVLKDTRGGREISILLGCCLSGEERSRFFPDTRLQPLKQVLSCVLNKITPACALQPNQHRC